jgi:hypothetical protein
MPVMEVTVFRGSFCRCRGSRGLWVKWGDLQPALPDVSRPRQQKPDGRSEGACCVGRVVLCQICVGDTRKADDNSLDSCHEFRLGVVGLAVRGNQADEPRMPMGAATAQFVDATAS